MEAVVDFTLEQLRTGDRVAWKNAIDHLFRLVHGVLFRRSRGISEADIEDIAIESITKVMKVYLPTVLTIEALKNLVVKTALNNYKDSLDKWHTQKRGRGQVGSLEGQPVDTEYASSSPTPAQALETVELALSIDEALSQIPEKWAGCLRDHCIVGRPYKEIAETRGITTDEVGVAIHRAKKALQPILIKMGLVVRNETELPLDRK